MASLSPLMQEILQSGGTVELTVTGNSMWPTLLHKVSKVRLSPVSSLHKGDLPLYRRDNGAFVLHRIIKADDGMYTCCGDNQWHLEHDLRHDQMLAVVTHFSRKNRWVSADCIPYSAYWRIWVFIRPLRRLVFGGLKRIKQTLRRILK